MKISHMAGVALLLICGGNASTSAEPIFSFESVLSLDDMTTLVRSKLPLGTSRADVRRTFVNQGHATLKTRTGSPGIEKYIYDIDLCHYYIWRWNISADYDVNSKLLQAYVNGNTVFPGSTEKRMIPTVAGGEKTSIYLLQRPRPEAYKGEKSLGFVLLDSDSDPSTTDDQVLTGAGPSRADPMNMGNMFAYSDVDPWRSIFDSDAADRIVPYQGDCKEVDRHMEAQQR